MSKLSSFFGGGAKPPIEIINHWSEGDLPVKLTAAGIYGNCKTITCGTLVAATFETQLSITGSGVVNFLCSKRLTSTLTWLYCKLTIDGVVVFDRYDNSSAVVGEGLVVIGAYQYTSVGIGPCLDSVPFNDSLVFEVKSDVGGTGIFDTDINYRLT